jgi:hypothetical protein
VEEQEEEQDPLLATLASLLHQSISPCLQHRNHNHLQAFPRQIHMGSGSIQGQQQQQSNQQNSGGYGNFGNFGFSGQGGGGGNILNDHTAQMGVHFGRQMAQAGGEYVEKNVSKGTD